MSDNPTPHSVRRATRVRMLGDAVPVVRGAFAERDEVVVVPKTADDLRADRDARRDAAPMSSLCGVEGCSWRFSGTAGECRSEAAAHRASAHPEMVDARTYLKRSTFWRRTEPVDQATVAESRKRRQERDDAQRIDTINRGRRGRGEPLLEEVADAGHALTESASAGLNRPAAERSAASSSTYTPRPGTRPARLVALMANGRSMRLVEIVAESGDGYAPVAACVADLVQRRVLVKVARGVYAAAVSEREPEAQIAPLAEGSGAAVEPAPQTAVATAELLLEPSSRSETAAGPDLTIDVRTVLLLLRRDVARLAQTIDWLTDAWQAETGCTLEEAA